MVERANDRSSDAESFFLKTRGPFSSTSFSRSSSPSSLSRDVQSSINNLAPTVSINRHWCKARRGARVQRGETEAGRSPRAPRFNRSRGRSWKTELWTSYGSSFLQSFTYSQGRAVLSLESLSFSRTRLQAARSGITRDTSRRQIDRLCRTGADWE